MSNYCVRKYTGFTSYGHTVEWTPHRMAALDLAVHPMLVILFRHDSDLSQQEQNLTYLYAGKGILLCTDNATKVKLKSIAGIDQT